MFPLAVFLFLLVCFVNVDAMDPFQLCAGVLIVFFLALFFSVLKPILFPSPPRNAYRRK